MILPSLLPNHRPASRWKHSVGSMAVFLLAAAESHAGFTVNPDQLTFSADPAASAYQKQITRDPASWVWNIPLPFAKVTHGVLHSAAMDRDVGYNVYLPPGYADDLTTRYPVVYYCHGATGSESSDLHVAHRVDAEIARGHIGKVIYVFMNAGHFSGYRDRPQANIMAETLVIEELIPEIDRRFRTIAAREGRALMGFSMGGGGALRLAFKYPELFCAVASYGGALGRLPGIDEPARSENPDNIYDWATTNRARLKDRMGLFLVVGQNDRMYPLHPPFVEHLHGLGIAFQYHVLGGVGHDPWKTMEECGGDAIRFLASHYGDAQTDG